MGQDLIITAIKNDHAKMIIARLISQKQSVAFQTALQIISNPPIVFLINASPEEIQSSTSQLSSIGVSFRLIQSVNSTSEEKTAPMPIQNTKVNLEEKSSPIPVIKEKEIERRPIEIAHTDKKNDVLIISENQPEKKSGLLKYLPILILFLLISLPVLLVVLTSNNKPSRFLSDYDNNHKSDSSGSLVSAEKSDKNNHQKSKITEAENKKRSNELVDSAVVNAPDYEKAIKFYQLAISFNKNNYKAWYGLINAYYNVKQIEDAHRTEEEMKRIFGDAILTLDKIIEPYGTLINAQLNDDSTYTVEYKSSGSNKKALLIESYQIIKAMQPNCNCEAISLFASLSAGRGMIVHIKKAAVFTSISEFEKAASVTYLE